MLYEHNIFFTSIEDIWLIGMMAKLPPVTNPTDWAFELYVALQDNLTDFPDARMLAEIESKLKSDILNHPYNSDFYTSPSSGKLFGSVFYNVWASHHDHFNNNLENRVATDVESIEEYVNNFYGNDTDIGLFDRIRINKPTSPNHGKEGIIVGLARENGTLLYNISPTKVDSFGCGYGEYHELEKIT